MRRQSQRTRVLHVMAMASIIVVPGVYISIARLDASATPAPLADEADSFAADISVHQAFIAPDGAPVQQSPPRVDLRMERWRTGAGWHTAITMRDIERPMSAGKPDMPIEHPFLVTRMEYDGDGSAPRYFNQRGERVRPLDEVDLRLLDVSPAVGARMPKADVPTLRVSGALAGSPRPDWIDNVVARPSRRAARRQALEERYGPARGRVNGLDRYVTTRGDATTEVLVDPASAVPVEINLARGTELVARNAFTHEPRPDGVLVRRLWHSERIWSATKGTRAIADVSVSNVTLAQRGIQ